MTEEYSLAKEQIQITFDALETFNFNLLVIMPNNDAGSLVIQNEIDRRKNNKVFICENLPRMHFLSFMNNAEFVIGNSSSGLLEAPASLNLPAINIGRRQAGRVKGQNVINANFENKSIVHAIRKALSPSFKNKMKKGIINPLR